MVRSRRFTSTALEYLLTKEKYEELQQKASYTVIDPNSKDFTSTFSRMRTKDITNCVTPIQLPESNSPFASEIGPDIEMRDREIRPVNSAITILTEAGELTDRGRKTESPN